MTTSPKPITSTPLPESASQPLNICHVTRSLDPAFGGPPVVTLTLAAAQAAQGHRVRVVGFERDDRKEAIEKLVKQVPGSDRVERIGLPESRVEYALCRNARARMREVIREVDFVHLHSVWEPIILWSSVECRRASMPYCVTPHGSLYPYMLSQKALKKRLFWHIGYRTMLAKADFVHVLNEDERNAADHLRLPSRYRIYPNSLDLAGLPDPQPGSFRARHGALADRDYFVYVGRLHPMKAVDVLVEAFNVFVRSGGGADLVVIGPDYGAEQEIRAIIARCGLQSRVHLTGPLFGVDKFSALRDAYAYAHISRHETFSMAITEALAMGLPAVITEQCHFPEVAREGCGTIVPFDPQAFGQAMLAMWKDRDGAKAMGARGRALVESRFGSDTVAADLVKAYREVIAERARSRP